MKICSMCNTEKDDSFFLKNNKRCRLCRNELMKVWRSKNPERQKELIANYYATHKKERSEYMKAFSTTTVSRMQIGMKNAAKRLLEWTLTTEEFKEASEKPCYYCNNQIDYTKTGAGLDRIDNEKGYTPDNVIACCGTCNVVRGNKFTVEETKVMIEAVIQYRNTNKDTSTM